MTPDKVRTLAPEFSDDSDEVLTTWIELARERMAAPSVWGRVYGTAVAYLAAHLKTIAARGAADEAGSGAGAGLGGVGPVTSAKVGRWSVTMGGAMTGAESGLDAKADASLVTTRHGKEFLALRRTRSAGKSRIIRPNSVV